jgi:hypothetical protein
MRSGIGTKRNCRGARIFPELGVDRLQHQPAGTAYVHGEADGPCKFLIVQGVGVYDFVAVGA